MQAEEVHRLAVPLHSETQIWIDFDGTITRQDVLDELIKAFSQDDSWKQVELQWQEGLIGSKECLARQLATISVSDADLEQFLDAIRLDEGIFPLIRLADRMNVPVAILSDGVEGFIRRLLSRNGLGDLTVRCNQIERTASSMSLLCPYANINCTSGAAHCKCGSIDTLGKSGRKSVYIGDGRSDLCPSRKADCVFAKGILAQHLEREGKAFIPYIHLGEVAAILGTIWGVSA